MSGPIYFNGIVDLKDDVDIETIRESYVFNECETHEDQLEIEDGEFEDYDGSVRISVEGGQLIYLADFSDGSYSWANLFENFLLEIAEKYAAKAWLSTEGEHGPDQTEVAYGPSEMSKLIAVRDARQVDLTYAQEAFDRAQKAVDDAA